MRSSKGRKASVWYGFKRWRNRKIKETASLRKLRMGDTASWNGFSPQMSGLWTPGYASTKTGGKKY